MLFDFTSKIHNMIVQLSTRKKLLPDNKKKTHSYHIFWDISRVNSYKNSRVLVQAKNVFFLAIFRHSEFNEAKDEGTKTLFVFYFEIVKLTFNSCFIHFWKLLYTKTMNKTINSNQ